MTELRDELHDELGALIWTTSRSDEGSISRMGALHVAQAIRNKFNLTPKE